MPLGRICQEEQQHMRASPQDVGRALGAGRDKGVEGDDVWAAVVLGTLLKELQRQVPVPGLLARADQAAVRDHTALTALRRTPVRPCVLQTGGPCMHLDGNDAAGKCSCSIRQK